MNLTFTYNSKSSPAVYTVQVGSDGTMSCNCRGWIIKRPGRERGCTHTSQTAQRVAAPIAAPKPIVPVAPPQASTGYVEPMLASKMPEGKTVEDFSVAEWVCEEKFDGHRKIVCKKGNEVRAWSRPAAGSRQGLSSSLPPHIMTAVLGLPDGTYDCEQIVAGGKSWDVAAAGNSGKQSLVIFDVLEIVGHSTLRETFESRRALLETAFGTSARPGLQLSAVFAPSKEAVEAIWKRGGEGGMLKKKTSVYRPGARPDFWVKVKLVESATLTITGFTEGKSGPYSTVNVRDAEGNETKVKTLNARWLREFSANAQSYIGKRLVISYQGRTPSGNYRHATFDHLAGGSE